ncbi:hypothetical protein C5167_018756 [Papaver somniferum]|uniref:Uncharacterized protein n=1 Tax=Papaver somniferum TaxID=3469 RepID=A0A4Y7IS67_PAPSO|nr:hypothetical protein C5167_018756 [Papaver somniferum]
MRKKRMCRLVGRANSTLAEIMVRLGLFERLEIASMDDPNYSHMWKYLRDQFEMEQKFVGLDFYLNLMEVFIQFVAAETTRRWQLTYSILFISGHAVRWCVELQLPRIMLETDLKGIDSYLNTRRLIQ